MYSTFEPCFMCFGALAHFRFAGLVYGVGDGHAGALDRIAGSGYYDARIPRVVGHVMERESRALLEEYVEKTGWRRALLPKLR